MDMMKTDHSLPSSHGTQFQDIQGTLQQALVINIKPQTQPTTTKPQPQPKPSSPQPSTSQSSQETSLLSTLKKIARSPSGRATNNPEGSCKNSQDRQNPGRKAVELCALLGIKI
ncbi:hypothetical protein TNIN_389361 [Trichonephila inaurata madagascariensis]|uniref:Uncharacterized protein n=1 Tax=Trichonephila inaurata madagascariensis TaxID=2747483 RepID=A0A8X6Y5I3_9ARAC|nr:hypothetical protein TNIN_389361 [Trichonephila inaurata madagascariensis]